MIEGRQNVLFDKASAFATRTIKMVKALHTRHVEPFMINQVGKSGTGIGANISESRSAQSRADFVNKLKISLKEADETNFWLDQLQQTEGITEAEYNSMKKDLMEIIFILNSIIKKTLQNGI